MDHEEEPLRMTSQRQDLNPDFLRMDAASTAVTQPGIDTDEQWMGWPGRNQARPVLLHDKQGRVMRVRTPVTDLDGLMTPTHLFYVVQHFPVPQPVEAADWKVAIAGAVQRPGTLTYDELRRLPARTVRTVMECSGSDADFFEYFKGEGPRPSRTREGMILSAGEFTGVPLATVLARVGLGARAAHVRVEGWDFGRPGNDPAIEPFYYDKCLPLEKALHPDTILAWAQNGERLEHLHGAPVRLVVPGWSGNWSIKWVRQIEVREEPADCWYHFNFYYYGDSPDDPNKELITTIGVKSLVTFPKDDEPTLPCGTHVIRGRAWSGAGAITHVEVSVDGGATWHTAHLEPPRERWMWVRWSYVWEAQQPGCYRIMARATDEVGRVQPREPRYNNMRKNFNAIVANEVTVS
jgi:DMSO/TMAO reductase YedYZ molybdopterin-dependent catalytic subunit